MNKSIEKYTCFLKKLRRASVGGGAPHKPVLLLAVFSCIRNGQISSNRIYISPELIVSYREIWNKLVNTNHSPKFYLPFFHLRTEPFWKLIYKSDADFNLTSSHSINSITFLVNTVECAEIDEEFFELLKNEEVRDYFENEILLYYFNQTCKIITDSSIIIDIGNEILNEEKVSYQSRIEKLEQDNNLEQVREEIIIRGSIFKREVPRIYEYRCAISGMSVSNSFNYQMVDACHIIPFALSKDDTIGNGISLCPNLHRAFDRGLLTINPNYMVQISTRISEEDSPYSLLQFNGLKIQLPENDQYCPLVENLAWHNKNKWLG
jgi:putative restriction endonuclease